MTKEEYVEYVNSVNDFFKREGIINLSPEAGDHADHDCVICGETVGYGEGYFSSQPCECCGSYLGGTRYHATGYCPEINQGLCFEVCPDCIYFAEYGQLDDMTMLDMEA